MNFFSLCLYIDWTLTGHEQVHFVFFMFTFRSMNKDSCFLHVHTLASIYERQEEMKPFYHL